MWGRNFFRSVGVFGVAGGWAAEGTPAFAERRETPDEQRQPTGASSSCRGAGTARRERSRRRFPAGSGPWAAADAGPGSRGAPRRRLQRGPALGSVDGGRAGWETLRGAAGHDHEAAKESWEDDDSKTLDFPFVENSLGVTDALRELLLRDRVDRRCKVTLQSENLSCAQAHGEDWAEILGFQTEILKILG